MMVPSYICRHMHNVRNWRSELERMTDDGFKDVSYAGPPPYSRRQALNFGIITIACEILFLLTGDIKKSMPLLIDKIMDFKEALLSHNPWTRVPKNAIAIKKLSILVTHRPHIFSCRIRGRGGNFSSRGANFSTRGIGRGFIPKAKIRPPYFCKTI